MKRILLSLLVIILALGLLGAVGFAGYRYGYTQGMIAASSGTINRNGQLPGPGFWMTPRGMPTHNFGFTRDFDGDGLRRLERGGFGFGIFPLFGLLARLLFWGLIIAGIVWLITRSGWRLARTESVTTTQVPPAQVVEPPPPSTSTTTTTTTTTEEENPEL